MMITNKNYHEQEEEESEETLSLSDLPIYSNSNNSADWEKYLAKQYQSSSISSSSSTSFSSNQEDDLFEFFSEEWNSPNPSNPPDNIIFCGKIIPSKQPSSDSTPNVENDPPSVRKRCLLRWNSDVSFYKSRRSTSKSNKQPKLLNSKSFPTSESRRRKRKGFSVGRRVTSMFMFGLARFPSDHMELSHIRNRQSGRGPSTLLFRPDGVGEKVAVCRRSKNGLWSLVRAFCCGGNDHRTNAVVKASFCHDIPLI